MPRFRIHRMKDSPRESFRWSAHTGGLAVVKTKDYLADGEVEAQTPYAVWKGLATTERPLRPGDLLEIVDAEGNPGQLHIAKYIGFEPAQWWVPEPNALSHQTSDAGATAG
jgi:hypothetical protein